MPRSITQDLVNELEAQESAESLLVFLTLSHPQFSDPIRIVSNELGDKIDDHILAGAKYVGLPFHFEILSDDERPARSRLSMININREIGRFARALPMECRITIGFYAASDFSATIDRTESARTPIGTPTREYFADYLFLRNVRGDDMVVEGDLDLLDLTGEPWPSIRTTQDRLPGLFR